MSLKAKYHLAKRIIQNLEDEDRLFVHNVCLEIREAEKKLQHQAKQLMTTCHEECKGICCRNLFLDAIITEWDFVYILTLQSNMDNTIVSCLEKEILIFTSDCIFLQNGVGPCIFPSHVMPQVCITTFCNDETFVKNEIREVKQKFFKLSCYRFYRTYRFIKNFLCRWCQIMLC